MVSYVPREKNLQNQKPLIQKLLDTIRQMRIEEKAKSAYIWQGTKFFVPQAVLLLFCTAFYGVLSFQSIDFSCQNNSYFARNDVK